MRSLLKLKTFWQLVSTHKQGLQCQLWFCVALMVEVGDLLPQALTTVYCFGLSNYTADTATCSLCPHIDLDQPASIGVSYLRLLL
jgi:hypothetical protein